MLHSNNSNDCALRIVFSLFKNPPSKNQERGSRRWSHVSIITNPESLPSDALACEMLHEEGMYGSIIGGRLPSDEFSTRLSVWNYQDS